MKIGTEQLEAFMLERFLSDNITSTGPHLLFAGQDTSSLATQYGTPLYLMDEERIRENCRTYVRAIRSGFGKGTVLYAAKAACFTQILRIIKDEEMSLDVVSAGEIHTALCAGFPMEHVWFHSSNKTDADIRYAISNGVGHFIVDSLEELEAIDRIAGERGVVQPVLLRLTPGIDPHTFAAVATGTVDSKFGIPLVGGQAEAASLSALSKPNIRLDGYHCHVGSQVFDSDVFFQCADVMLDFISAFHSKTGYLPAVLNLGGGYGVAYRLSDPAIDIEENILSVSRYVRQACARRGLPVPEILLEPGRSIVADAGMTLYTVGMVKRIPGLINYVSIDGGMADNIRYALYGAPYTVLPASRMDEPRELVATVVGRCCESDDVIQPSVPLPESISRGDLIAVCTTGAYNYSMASNYNRLPRPPIVMLRSGSSYIAVKRETFEDLTRLDQ